MWSTLPGWVRDAVMIAVLLIIGLLPYAFLTPSVPVWVLIGVYTVATIAVVLLRHRFDYLALVVGCGPLLIAAALINTSPGSILPASLALYAITRRRGLRPGLICLGATLVAVVITALVMTGFSLLDRQALGSIAFLGAAVALGETGRVRRAYIKQITERAERAEATREAEARRRVAEDRLRIAQDLHDVVAHQIAVINLQAAVASSAVRRDPEAAGAALTVIHTAARSVLHDIGGLLAMLRQEDGDDHRDDEAVISMDRLGELIERFRRSGLAVELSGQLPDRLSAAVDLVAYRVVQEALTNVHKHGTGTARLGIETSGSSMMIMVVNPISEVAAVPAATGSGHGLQGIRERVAAVHGLATATRENDEFRLTVRIPLPPIESESRAGGER